MFIYGAKIENNLLTKDNVCLDLATLQEVLQHYSGGSFNNDEECIINKHIVKSRYSLKMLAIEIDSVLFHTTDLGLAEFLLTRGISDEEATLLFKDKYKMAYYRIDDLLYIVQENVKDTAFAEFSIKSLLKEGLFEVENAEELYKDRSYKGHILFTDALGFETYLEPIRQYGNVKATYLIGSHLGMGFSKKGYLALLSTLKVCLCNHF